jgi:1-acyl-sn-glycerol-3-phosphate acyltransferase
MAEKTQDKRILKLLMEDTPESIPSDREQPLEQLAQRLESRIGEMEAQMGFLRDHLKNQNLLLEKSNARDSEINNLAKMLEQKILRYAEEFYQSRRGTDSHSSHFIYEQIKKLAHVVTLDGFKHLLSSIWYRGRIADTDIDEFGMDYEFALKVKPFFDFLYYNYWRVTVKNIHNIPDQGRGLVVSNHSGTLPYDGSMIRLASVNDHPSQRDVRFLVEDFVYHFPFLGTFMHRTGGVRACPENAARLLESDHVVAVFPEGVKGIGKLYKHRYRLQRFGRGGFIRLALRTGSPIIPAAVIGAEEIHPLLYKSTFMAKPLGVPYIPVTPTFPLLGPFGLIPLPSKWMIIFGEPISWKQYGPKHAEDPLLVNRLSEEVRTRIQEMIFEGLAARRSVWFG